MADEYEQNKIAEYKYWSLYLHPNQCYLGRTIIWCKRADALDLMKATQAEKDELFEIGEELQATLDTLFKPDLYNYAALANVTPHLHIHFIPRYRTIRKFAGTKFIDERWGENYTPYNKSFSVSRKIFDTIRDAIRQKLK